MRWMLMGVVVLALVALSDSARARTYYVSVEGDDAMYGLSEAEAWRTIAYAAERAKAGDTVRIKAGDYGPEHVVISNSGTEEQPILLEGYDGTPGIDGQDRTGKAIVVDGGKYVQLRNIAVTRYEWGVFLRNAEHVVLDSITATNLGTSGYSGWGIYLGSSHHCVVRNCSVTDARAVNFQIWHSNHNLVEGCTSYGVESDNAVDYYIVIGYSHDNVVRDCVTQNRHLQSKSHAGHGIGIKDTFYKGQYSGTRSYNNKIIDCETHGHGEHLWVAHYAHDNEFINCTAYNEDLNPYHQWNHGLVIRDGAHDNVFRNCTAIGVRSGANLHDTSETPETAIQVRNRFLNCIFDVTDAGIYLSHARENVFRHCVVTGAKRLFGSRDESDNTLADCIVTNIRSWGSGKPAITYSDFWHCGFDVPSGMGNMRVDPLFADPAKGDYRLTSKAGRWDAETSRWVHDDATSPCIDAGDPRGDFATEPEPNGGRANIGAHGNSAQASRSAGRRGE